MTLTTGSPGTEADSKNDANSSRPSWFRGAIQGKTRIFMAWVFAFLIGFSARRYPAFPGIVLCLVGATLRFWASGYLRKDSRPAIGGPYAFFRNPLYLGTYLMAVGITWAIGNLVLLAAVTVLFAAVYHFIILDEETKLRRIFGDTYLRYCRLVPRFFPRFWPPLAPAKRDELLLVNPEVSHHAFSWNLAMTNKAYEAYASFAGLVLFVSLVAYAWQRFGA